MNWTTIKVGLAKAGIMNKMMLFAVLFGSMSLMLAQGGTINTALCGVITTVQTVVGFVAVLLFVLGGVLYAIAHMMPSAGSMRGAIQGWSMGMIVGGIVGLILVILAPGLVAFIIGIGNTAGGGVGAYVCPSIGGL